jgi:tripartite ATP-independent transporter DctP family solute receptor
MVKKVVSSLLVLILMLVIGYQVPVQAQGKIELKLAEYWGKDYPTTLGDREFARLVEKYTNGRIHITVYDGGQLGDEKPVVEQVKMGALDFARISLAPVSQFAPELNVLTLPFIYRDTTHMWKVLSGSIGKDLLKSVEKAKMIGLCYYDAGARSFYNTKREIKSPEDMKGLKIRVQESKLMMGLVKCMGASPTPMGMGDVYSAMQTNVIDGAENNWPSYVNGSHYEVAKFYTVDRHVCIPEIIVASKITMAKLSAADVKIIEKAAAESVEFQKKKWADADKDCEAKAKAKGCKITYLTAAQSAKFQTAVQPLYADYKQYADLINKIKAVK